MEVTHSTFTLERRYPASVERVFQAWANPQARKRWMAQGAEHSQNFVVGGLETVRGSDPQGRPLTYQAQYAEIVTNERILNHIHVAYRRATVHRVGHQCGIPRRGRRHPARADRARHLASLPGATSMA
jgi:hypothetical protein